MEKRTCSFHNLPGLILAILLAGTVGCSAPLSTREKGALVGTGVGAATGAAVGSAVGHPGAGAAIGGALGLGAGALIGDQLQAQEQTQYEQQQQLEKDRVELERQRMQLERLRGERGEYSARTKDHPPYFLPDERRIVVEFFRGHSSGLPPGLAKRGGNLPPGLQRQLRRNGQLPPGLQKRLEPIPTELEVRLTGIPETWSRVILGSHVILMDRRTSLILDIIEDVI